MKIRQRKTFHGRWNARRGWWDLYCRRCQTTEELPEGNFPENVAQVHAQWWHVSLPQIPIGWANPGGSGRACDHRQCSRGECRGC